MSHVFAPPPPDSEYNQRIESHPDFPRACLLTRIITFAGVGTILLPIFMFAVGEANPKPVMIQILIVLSIVVMPASIFLVFYFRGLVWYNIRITVPNPSPFFGIFVAATSLTVTGVMNSFIAYGPLFLWASPVAFVFWLAMMFTTSEFKGYTKLDIGNMGAMLFVCYVFSFGAYTNSNCALDFSDPKVYPTTITKKEVHENRDHDKSYRLYFSPVAGLDDTKTEVHSGFYNSLEVNDTIRFNLKKGLWGSAWYYLEGVE